MISVFEWLLKNIGISLNVFLLVSLGIADGSVSLGANSTPFSNDQTHRATINSGRVYFDYG